MTDPVSLILKAADFAAHKHRDQRRKGIAASPYINHPIDLANILRNESGVTDPVILAAALLHDTLEDTETSWEELRGQFGEEIADIVAEVIADKISNLRDILANPPPDWPLERKQTYFDWAKQVVDGVRGAYPQLEQRFDALYRRRPVP